MIQTDCILDKCFLSLSDAAQISRHTHFKFTVSQLWFKQYKNHGSLLSQTVVWLCERSNRVWWGCVRGQTGCGVVVLWVKQCVVWLCEGSNSVWWGCVRGQTVCGVVV